jgi:hypothetical protein
MQFVLQKVLMGISIFKNLRGTGSGLSKLI